MSRLLGLARDVLMAWAFGANASIAALMVAFRFSSLLRRIFGEGALHAAFVPAYEKIRLNSEEEGASFFTDLSLILAGGLFLITLLVESALFYAIFKLPLSPSNREIFILMTALFPSLIFICHAAFCTSFLQCQGVYFLPAISPVFFNLFWIFGALIAVTFFKTHAVFTLAIFISLGLMAQWLSLFPKTFYYLFKTLRGAYRPTLTLMLKRASKLGKPLILGLIGVSTTQINNALDTLFARFVDLNGPAYLWYALRIEQVPVAIFGVALAGATLPLLSRAANRSQKDFTDLLDYTLARSMGLLVPCSVALLVMGPIVVSLLYMRGQFDLIAAKQTTYALWCYAVGLAPHGLSLILASSFYSKNNYKITTWITFYCLLLNCSLNALFAFYYHLESFGIALATSLTSFFQCACLFYFLKKIEENVRLKSFQKASFRVLLATLIAAGAFMLLRSYQGDFLCFRLGLQNQIQQFFVECSLFLALLVGCAWLFRAEDIFALFRLLPIPRLKKKA